MPRLKSITIENFRSIGEVPVTIRFPENKPVILLGENNSGKSNIVRAIELLFGEFHPKYKKLDDYDHYQRNPHNRIVITADVSGFVQKLGKSQQYSVGGFKFGCQKNHENEFVAIQAEDGGENVYVSTSLREELLCVMVNAEQSLNYQLSYSTKYTFLYKVTKAFHDRLLDNPQRVDHLKTLFNEIVTIFQGVPEFSAFTNNMSSIAGEMLSNMRHALSFDFSAYDPSNYFKTLRVHPTEDGQTRAFEELGTGQQQILALAFAHAYAKSFLGQGLVFVIDEPEAHLHPLAQKWLAKQIFRMAEDGLQIVITTHSPYFIDLNYLESICLIRKEEQTEAINVSPDALAQKCRETGAPNVTANTVLSYYSAHAIPATLNGLFASKIILVEGPTEEYSLPIYLNAVGLDTLKMGIAVIGVGGKGNLAKWWRFFTAYRIPTYVCFDNDATDDQQGNKRRDALRAIGIQDDEIGNLLTTEHWNIGERFCVFGSDFEATMRSSFSQYVTLEAEEREELGDSKPIVARAVANRLASEDIDPTELGWSNFNQLQERLLQLT
jgi:putative ATP-dependent endonuclease of OLD family